MAGFYGRSVSSPGESIGDNEGDFEDGLSHRRKKQSYASSKSLSMATIQAQVSLAQSIRNLFLAARSDSTCGTDGDSSVETAWLQALYNSVVLLIFAVVIFVLIAVYYVLEPFLHPLLWAVLVGIFLHPFKSTATNHIEQWLSRLEEASVPLAAGVVISPFAFVNYLSMQFEFYFTKYFKSFIVLLGTVVILYLAVTFNVLYLMQEVFTRIDRLLNHIDDIVSFKWVVQVLPFLLVFGGALCFIGSSKGPAGVIVKSVIATIWYLVLSVGAGICLGYIGIPLITILFVVSLLVWMIRSRARSDDAGMAAAENEPIGRKAQSFRDRRQSFFQKLNTNVIEKSLGIIDYNAESEDMSEPEEITDFEEVDREMNREAIDIDTIPYATGTENESSNEDENLRKRHNTVRFLKAQTIDRSPSPVERRGSPLQTSYSVDSPYYEKEKSLQGILKEPASNSGDSFNVMNIFLVLITTCLIVFLWRNLWVLLIIAPLVLWTVIKRYILFQFPVFLSGWKSLQKAVKHKFSSKKNLLFPQPIPIFIQLCGKLDRFLLHMFKSSVSPIISGGIIVALVIGGIGAFVFFILQVQVELAYSVNMMKQVLNTSVSESPWIQSVVLGSDGINSTVVNSHLEQFADQGYLYGREWLKGQVKSLINGSDDGVVVDQILKLYDSFYQFYVIKNATVDPNVSVDNISVHTHEMEGFKEHLFHEAKNIVSDNMETIVTIMKSLWSLVSVNVSIGLSIFTSLLSIIFSGGTMLLNLVVFITTLFYLLAYSSERYLPEEWIMSFFPSVATQSSDIDYAASFAKVIRGVFHASFQRAFFYGLYTWLVLSVLGMEMTVVPSVLASVTGAIPFIGPYWVSVPAVLELWLIQGSPLLALLAIVLFLLPPFTVDTVINREIQGGHPYLTGLAIAGGVYFAGLEGAIFGPILLCCLLFLVNFLTAQL